MRIFAKIVICLGLVLLTLSCSASKKIQAANILKKCKFTYHSMQMEGFSGDSLKFSVFLNANNAGADSLFVENLKGSFHLDSLFEIPFNLQNSRWISPGDNQMKFSGALELNLFKILALPNVKKFRMQGKAFIALKPGQKSIDVDFDESHDIPPDMLEKTLKKIIGL
ncbi:MAG: hypothetical protein FWB90_00445 [Fibromonadales bacterium]|nr:hypothetical protein [Fibromonadales bacterium]